jgi:hypothetical protein
MTIEVPPSKPIENVINKEKALSFADLLKQNLPAEHQIKVAAFSIPVNESSTANHNKLNNKKNNRKSRNKKNKGNPEVNHGKKVNSGDNQRDSTSSHHRHQQEKKKNKKDEEESLEIIQEKIEKFLLHTNECEGGDEGGRRKTAPSSSSSSSSSSSHSNDCVVENVEVEAGEEVNSFSNVDHNPTFNHYYLSQLESVKFYLLGQVEYYFSVENLCRDIYFRQQMDKEGFVPISLIANFNRIKALTSDIEIITDALSNSQVVEVQEGKVRRRVDWALWVFPN